MLIQDVLKPEVPGEAYNSLVDIVADSYIINQKDCLVDSPFLRAITQLHPEAIYSDRWYKLGTGYFLELTDIRDKSRSNSLYGYSIGIVLDATYHIVNITDEFIIKHLTCRELEEEIASTQQKLSQLMETLVVE